LTSARVDPFGVRDPPGFAPEGMEAQQKVPLMFGPWPFARITILLIILVIMLLTGGELGYRRRGRRGV
jgi:hypothetical protein